jgi:hypothetical protein
VHSPRVFAAEGFLEREECGQLIDLAERKGFSSAGVRTADGFWRKTGSPANSGFSFI